MRSFSFAVTLLLAAFTVGAPMAYAQDQQPKPSQAAPPSPAAHVSGVFSDLAVTYTTERSNVVPGGGQFWLQGGSIDGALTFVHGFGLALNTTGDFNSRIAPGVGLVDLSAMAGPRYTRRLGIGAKHETWVFGEALAGVVRAEGSAFPKTTGFDTRASSFTYQAGGGVDIAISKRLAIRAIEADYVVSQLPNNANNRQTHLRLAFGICLRSAKH
jgi:peptidoglycan-associated lipoprotein